MEKEVKILKIKSGSGSVTYRLPIPAEVRDHLDIDDTSIFTIEVKNDSIIYKLERGKRMKNLKELLEIVSGNEFVVIEDYNCEEFDTKVYSSNFDFESYFNDINKKATNEYNNHEIKILERKTVINENDLKYLFKKCNLRYINSAADIFLKITKFDKK